MSACVLHKSSRMIHDDFETLPAAGLAGVNGGFLQFLALGAALAPVIGKLVDAGRGKKGRDGKGSEIGDASGNLLAAVGGAAQGSGRGPGRGSSAPSGGYDDSDDMDA